MENGGIEDNFGVPVMKLESSEGQYVDSDDNAELERTEWLKSPLDIVGIEYPSIGVGFNEFIFGVFLIIGSW